MRRHDSLEGIRRDEIQVDGANTDGETLNATSARFEVIESSKLGPALDGLAGFERAEDMQQQLEAAVRTYRLTGKMPPSPEEDEVIPGPLNETLVLDLLAPHYREWLDLPVPAVDDRTPRAVVDVGRAGAGERERGDGGATPRSG